MNLFRQINQQLALKHRYREFLLTQGEAFFRNLEKHIATHSLIGDRTFFDPAQFLWIDPLEANWKTIREELDRLLTVVDHLPNFQDISVDQISITQDNRWKTYFLYAYGIKLKQNCDRCPQTTQLIEQIPGMKTAFFSILLPGKHIPEHRGPYKGVLRYHLALKVPQDWQQCGIRVGNEVRHWQIGKSLVFDDTFPHAAWNHTKETRVILFLDVVRPMRFPFSIANQCFIQLIAWSPYVQAGKVRADEWSQRLEELVR
jgi:beta-hydroxylase